MTTAQMQADSQCTIAGGGEYVFTSESVTKGHPDKVADQISDGILDAYLAQDPDSRVACETLVTTNHCTVAGEITSKGTVDVQRVIRDTIKSIGYTDETIGFDFKTCEISCRLHAQSPDIDRGVSENEAAKKDQGAGDQGMMFGYACDETPVLMPLPIYLAHRMSERLSQVRESGEIPWLRPDGKTQVTVHYLKHKPVAVEAIVLASQYSDADGVKAAGFVAADGCMTDKGRDVLKQKVARPVMPAGLWSDRITFHVNPTGRFVVGGPAGDTGVTGRKIIVDTYGGRGRHGGGAFSGKDPSKVDRSAAYMGRYIAKNIVAAGLASEVEVQFAYAIGVAEPVSVLVYARCTTGVDEKKIARLVRDLFPLTPKGIIRYLDLKRPIYQKTAHDGHFGRELPEFTWERTDMADTLRKAAGL
jgi:S-adenosylmethionine synthetase